MKKNTHYFNGQKSKRKIVYGKEKAQEYNAISQEIEKTFCIAIQATIIYNVLYW